MKKQIVHGYTTYESMTACMDALDLSYSVLSGLLHKAELGESVMLLGQPIRYLSGASKRADRPKPLAVRAVVKQRRPLLIGQYCTHRLGVYHGGRA